MRKGASAKWFLLGCLTVGSFFGQAQTQAEIFDRKSNLVWLGLDFTAAKFAGDQNRWNSTGRTQDIIRSLNDLMVSQSRKFDIASALRKKHVENRIQITREHNSSLDMENASADGLNGHYLNNEDVQEIVGLYDFAGLNGTGVMFIVEAFDKQKRQAIVWVTFIDLESKQVVMTKKMAEEPAGFGVRNYWAGSILKIIERIKKKDYELWRRQYFRRDNHQKTSV